MTWQSEDDTLFTELRNFPKRGMDPSAKQRILLQLAQMRGVARPSTHAFPRWFGTTAAGFFALCLIAVFALLPEGRAMWHNQPRSQTPTTTPLLSNVNAYVSMLGFEPKLPSYIPDGFRFKQIHVETDDSPDGQRKSLTALYETGQQSLTVTEVTQSGVYAVPDAVEWQPLTINGQPAQSTVLPDNRLELKLTDHGINYLILATSGIKRDDLIRVVSHLNSPVKVSPSVITQNVTGYDRAVKQLSFTPVQQNYVPPGYRLKSASAHITVQQGTKDEAFVLSYDDNLKHLFVVAQQTGRHDTIPGQSMDISGQQVIVTERSGNELIWWFNSKNHVTYHVSGQVSLALLKRVAERVIQQG